MSAAFDKAYTALREQIFSGTLAAGTRLKERVICCELDVSRTPVREALRRLEADGLVTIEPRRGAVVAGIDAKDAQEIFPLGALLESYAARIAANNATPADIEKLTDILDAMERTLSDDTPSARSHYLELDSELHAGIVAITGNRHLARIIRDVVGLPVLIRAFTHYSHPELQESLRQHRSIVAALTAGDADWAESAMRTHILAGRATSVDD